MDKLQMHTKDFSKENYEKLAALFPNAVTETIKDGEIVRAIDIDVLRQEISEVVVEGKEERYQFSWPDKRKALALANTSITKTLRPCKEKSEHFDSTENIYIEGDNLDALKILQEAYLGKVRVIYIDPPYNTGNDNFVYDDNRIMTDEEFAELSGQYDENNNLLYDMRTNNESNGRFHTDWLNMMYPRLKLAKNLLADDGAIFISIDEHEYENLKKICDEIFGSVCFVANVSWRKTYSPRNDAHSISSEAEYILIYSKQPGWQPNRLPRTEKMNSVYKNPDNDYSLWRTSDAFAPSAATHQGMVYAIQHPITGEMLYPYNGACWPLEQGKMLEQMNEWAHYRLEDIHDDERRANVCGVTVDEIRKEVKSIVLDEPQEDAKEKALSIIKRGQWPKFFFTKEGYGGIARKTYLDDAKGKVVTNYWPYEEVGHTDEAKKEIKALFDGRAPFDTPKPTRLLERIISIAAKNDDDIVMDFFSGSATTAHALMNINASNKKSYKYILMQMPELSSDPNYETLCDIGEERIRRASESIRKEHDGAEYDAGFRVFVIDESNMKDVYYSPADMQQTMFTALADNIKEDRTPEDLLFQVMLDLGVLPSSKIEEIEIDGKRVFNVADGFLIACFDSNVTEETVKQIAKKNPFYAVFRDSGMIDDSVATNFEQLFETYSPDTVRKVL